MADMVWTADLDGAINAFNNLNASINQLEVSGRASKKALRPLLKEIEDVTNALDAPPEQIAAIQKALNNIALRPSTMKAVVRELSTALTRTMANAKKGTDFILALHKQEIASVKRVIEVEDSVRERAARQRQQKYDQEQGRKKTQGDLEVAAGYERTQNTGNPDIVLSKQFKRQQQRAKAAALENARIKEAAMQADINQILAGERRADEINQNILNKRIKQEQKGSETILAIRQKQTDIDNIVAKFFRDKQDAADQERVKLEQKGSDTVSAIRRKQEETDYIVSEFFRKKDEDAAKERADLEQKGSDAVSEINKKQKETDYTVSEFFRKKEESQREKATRTFQAEVDKRIKAARDFEDAKRSGFTKGQFDSLKGGKLDDLETGARVSSGSPRDQFEAAAVKQMAENFKAAKASQDEVIAGAKRLGIPLRENVERAKEFTLSWKAMGRIIVAQAFTQVFFSMQNAIKQSTTEAVDLYKAVAQIQTIVSESSRGLANYSSALSTILDVSSDINFTPQDTANAFYDTLSNQIGDNVTQIREFIGAAGDLAKTTRSTLADSADAITAVMNAYGEGASSAEEISALLFATVDKGRVKLDAIANHMGNVAVPAAQLGIEFGKVGQALAALTIAGVTESEAMTLQRNVMFQLIKPTEDMVNLFHEWGVSSGQSAIAAFGFSGVIEKLAIEAEQGNERIAELFGTIRGVRGVQGLIGKSFESLNDTFEDGTKAIAAYNKSVDEYVSNSGEKFSKLQQEISNEFLRMGLRIVDLTVKFNDMIGVTSDGDAVLSKTVATIAKLGLVLGAAGSAFLIVMAAFGVGAAAIAAIPAAIFGTTVAIAALVAGLAGGLIGVAAFSKSASQEFGELKANVEKANAGIAESFEKGIIKSLADTDAVSKNSQVALASLADATAALNAEIKDKEAKKALDDLAAGLDNLIKAFGGDDAAQKLFHIFSSADKVRELYGDMAYLTNDYLRDTVSGHEKEADSIQQVIDKLEEQRKKLFDIAKENRNNLAESITERNINALPDNQRGRAQYQAAKGAASAGANAVDIDEAERLFDIANRFLADAERTAFESGAFGTIENHTRFFNKQQADLVALEERRLRVEDQRLAGLQAINAEQQAGYTKEATQFEKELDRRKAKETQFKIEKEFLEEYIRLRDQILKNEELSSDVQKERLDILTAQAAQGLDAIGASQGTRDAFSKELDKNGILNQTRVLYAEEERLTKQHKAYTEALKETDLAVEKYGNTLEESISAIEVAAREVLKNLPKDVDPTAVKVDASGITRIGSSIPNKEGTALVKELEQLNKAVEAGSITPEQAYSSLVDIASRVERLRASNSISNKNASGSLDAGLKGLEAATAQKSLAEALVRKTQDLEKALSDLTLEIRAMTGPRAETPEEAYNRAVSENGAASSEEEFAPDTGVEKVEQAAVASIGFLNNWAENTTKKLDDTAKAIDEDMGLLDRVLFLAALGIEEFKKDLAAPWSVASMGQNNQQNNQQNNYTIVNDQQLKAEEAARNQGLEDYEALGRLQAENEAQTFVGYLNDWVAQNQAQVQNDEPMINGLPRSAYPFLGDGSNTIDGKPMPEGHIYPDNYINGKPYIDDGVNNSASFANSIPPAIEQGAQAIPEAMRSGSYAVRQAVVDGMTEAFRREQANQGMRNSEDQFGPYDPRRFAMGGPVGTDTIPAWLSPGEFVVRAQAVRKNFDVLQAINAGTFQRFSNGGSVSNSQVFSSTFNMKTTNPQMQAAQIMSIMKRQISQGKATLGKGRPY